MNLLEYQSQELFEKLDIPNNNGVVIDSLENVESELQEVNYPAVVKAQVQVGGRGKAGGIQFADNVEEAGEICQELLYSELKGLEINKLLVVDKIEIAKEWYLSFTLDRKKKQPLLMFSTEGGVDIEETAEENPEKIVKVWIDPLFGVRRDTVQYLINQSGLDEKYFDQLLEIVNKLYKLFTEYDCLLAEINPLVVDGKDNLVALDAKVRVDDSALYRHSDVLEFRDQIEEHELVVEAREHDFLYIPIGEGDIGIISNGSGMIMSSMDIIAQEGMSTCSALDLGGGATADRVKEAVKIVLSNEEVEYLFINIFGGITRCDEIANGVKAAMNEEGEAPIVMRMEGTNKEKGVTIAQNMEEEITIVDGLLEGVDALYEYFNE